jgi:hypothetical protein
MSESGVNVDPHPQLRSDLIEADMTGIDVKVDE